MKVNVTLAVLIGLSSANALACYTVYDRGNAVVYHAAVPPVDMTAPYTERLNKVFPGSHMVFGSGDGCPATQAGYDPTRQQGVAAPLLTDLRTAEDMKVGHRVLPNGAVLVAKPPTGMRPGFTVMESAGRDARSGDRLSGSGPVITEMRDPPTTIIQDRSGVTTFR